MKNKTVAAIIVLAFASSGLIRWAALGRAIDDAPVGSGEVRYERIISLAPSITETLFAVGLGDRVVGVTRYCTYPPEAREKPQVGGFVDPNFEAMVALDPDLAVVLPVHGEAIEALAQLHIETVALDNRTIDGILDGIRTMGELAGEAERAEALLAEMHARMRRVQEKTAGLPRPRVIISAGRDLGAGKVREVYAAGKHQWYDEIITMAGGENAFTDENVRFPALSGEGLIRLQPDIIIEMAPRLDDASYLRRDVIEQWDVFQDIPAVRNKQVFVLSGSHVTIPGPRVVQVLEDVVRVIHPEIDWE